MEALLLVGRILFALMFLNSAIFGHFQHADATAGYAEMRGVRSARPLVLLSGAQLLLGAVGVILGIWIDLAALLLLVFLVAAMLLIHHFWTDTDPTMRQSEMVQFMKDMALAGAALIIFAAAANGADLGWTLTDPLF